MDNYRMMGCVCNEEDTNIKWMWLCEVRGFLVCYFQVINLSFSRAPPRGVNVGIGLSSRLTQLLTNMPCPCKSFSIIRIIGI